MRRPDGKSERGDDGQVGKARRDVVEMTNTRRWKYCGYGTKWKGDRARNMAEGYKMLHAGGDGRSRPNGVGIIVNVETS